MSGSGKCVVSIGGPGPITELYKCLEATNLINKLSDDLNSCLSLQFADHKTGCGDLTQSLACDGPGKFPMQISWVIIQLTAVQCKALFILLQQLWWGTIEPSLLHTSLAGK